ncbi:lasso peptide biosynthesis PqqD family chaperone [Amycolatopsis sp. CA-128772]|uniref:lasso peptide biosynthesis PqqD family chaperone n=1 Tax=Amycolatopsis sp. CA-128772 TaxID=2073159 RepID=UPI000CD2AE15|nr:lasso peptide biosynthesis PqqD family chaperone [Amycolatopsis sp. CA-128772]
MTYRLAKAVLVTGTEYGAVLLDERRGRYFSLNATGFFVLETLLDGDADLAAERVAERFAVPVETARDDVGRLIGTLAERGLLVTPREGRK